ncbi:MAG: tRNA pseudouridine55 synthase [Patescibacteria group bacterium]|jgi:tRNA pseudouridine55 synthase|nr:tRNA pseudouridine55 synthase [Patescibacteria group bacterium]
MDQRQTSIIAYKALGETPLEALERVRIEKGISKDLPMTYAGRLDPLAEGLLILLVGEECKKKEAYLGLDKVYETEVLFGVETDTHDLLGRLANRESRIQNLEFRINKKEIQEKLQKYKGKFVQEYPMYSSKTVDGKPLFMYAREGEEVEVPKREVEVFSIDVLEEKEIGAEELLKKVEEKISLVKGDFRQEETLRLWRESLQDSNNQFQIVKFKIHCGSGFYVRQFAMSLGNDLGCGALAFSIKRTKIGNFS